MTIRRCIPIASTVACLAVIAACAPAPAEVTENPPNGVAQATDGIPTLTPQTTARQSLTAAILPTNTPRPANTVSPTATQTAPDIVLPGWVPEGAQARIGRGVINQIALAPDGKTVAVAGATGLSLFTTDSFQEVWSIPTQTEVTHVSFLEDGLTIATLSLDDRFDEVGIGLCYGKCFILDRIYIWNILDGGLIKTLPLNFSGSFKPHIAFSDIGNFLAIADSSESTVDVWNLASGTKIRQWVNTPIDGMDLSFDGHSLATHFEKTVCIRKVDSGESLFCWDAPEELGEDFENNNFEFSPDGRLLASGWGRTIMLWDPSSGRIIRRLKTQLSPSALLFSSDGSRLANGSAAGVELWNVNTGDSIGITERIFQSRLGESNALRGMHFEPTTEELWIGGNGQILVVESDSASIRRSYSTPFTIWDEARFTSDGAQLQLRNYRSISYHRSTDLLWEGSVNYPQEALLSPDFSLYADRSSAYEILIAEIQTNKTVSRLQSADTPMAFSPLLNQLATIHFEPDSELRTTEIWNLESGKIHRALEFLFPDNNRGIREVIFSPDGTLVALISWAGEEGGDILLYNVMTGTVVEDFGINWTPIMAISSNGKMMVAECPWGDMGVLCMYDLDTGEKKIGYSANGSDFGRWTSLQISPNDGLVACGTSSGKIFLWDTTNGKLLRIAKGHNRAVTDLSFSPDGKSLASASADGSVVVWNLEG